MALSAGYLRKPQDVTALTKDGTVDRIPEKATGRHGSDKKMALLAGYLRKPENVTALTKDGAVGRIPEKATGRHGSDKRWRCRQD
jgi:hypothetical protein